MYLYNELRLALHSTHQLLDLTKSPAASVIKTKSQKFIALCNFQRIVLIYELPAILPPGAIRVQVFCVQAQAFAFAFNCDDLSNNAMVLNIKKH